MNKDKIREVALQLLDKLKVFLNRYPFIHIVVLVCIAPVGYLFPLLFPLAAYYACLGIYAAISQTPAMGWPAVLDWWPIALWLIVLVSSLFISYRLARIRPKEPVGLAITAKQAPALFALLEEMRVVRGQMPLHRVIVTDRFELDIIKTRVSILPVWSRNTLVIGLPLIQMMPPNAYRAMVARKLSQHSLFRNPLLHWLHQLNVAWRQYHACVADKKAPDMQVFELFYHYYSLLYAKLVEPIARMDGLSADSYTQKVINDEDIVESIEFLFVSGMFIEKIFWPRLRQLARTKKDYKLFPFATLSKVGLKSLAKLDVNAWLKKEMTSGASPRWGVAAMPVRLEGMGHNELFELEVRSKSAADEYFGDKLVKVITLMDRYWQKNTLLEWQLTDNKLRRESALMKILKATFKTREYGIRDLYPYFRVALQLRFMPGIKLVFKMFFLTRIGWSRKKSMLTT